MVLWVGASLGLMVSSPRLTDRFPHHQWLCHPAVAAVVNDLATHPEPRVSFERLADTSTHLENPRTGQGQDSLRPCAAR